MNVDLRDSTVPPSETPKENAVGSVPVGVVHWMRAVNRDDRIGPKALLVAFSLALDIDHRDGSIPISSITIARRLEITPAEVDAIANGLQALGFLFPIGFTPGSRQVCRIKISKRTKGVA